MYLFISDHHVSKTYPNFPRMTKFNAILQKRIEFWYFHCLFEKTEKTWKIQNVHNGIQSFRKWKNCGFSKNCTSDDKLILSISRLTSRLRINSKKVCDVTSKSVIFSLCNKRGCIFERIFTNLPFESTIPSHTRSLLPWKPQVKLIHSQSA